MESHDNVSVEQAKTSREHLDEGDLDPSQVQIGDMGQSAELTARLRHALHDQDPSYSLREVAHALVVTENSSDLDALQVVPLLLDSEDAAADEVLSLLAEFGNVKECVMAVQEAFERFHHDLVRDEDAVRKTTFLQIGRLLRICIRAIPRLKLRKRSAAETLRHLFADIAPVVELVCPSLRKGDRETAIQLICELLSSVAMWAAHEGDKTDEDAVKELCRTMLRSSLAEMSNSLETNFALRKFEICNSRLSRGMSSSGPSEVDSVLQKCLDTALLLSYSVDVLLRERAPGSLFLLSLFLSRTTVIQPSPNSLLAAVFPVLIASLQSGACIDASLTVLLHVLFPSSHNASTSIDPDYIAPLSTALASLASTSPDSITRLITFHVLAALLTRAPPIESMVLMRDLLSESPFPSMRVAAVGLLKGAVLESLAASANTGPDPFASPDMLQIFGHIVLRPDPPDLFARIPDRASLQAFMATQEPKRLVECLSFYYVLLMRDKHNVTGVREPSQMKSVEKEFLSPLRKSLKAWAELEDLETVDGHAMMALAALETSLERIDEAYETLNSRPS